jgi:DNA invertase Pin-like site-specific DNA recombinase
MSRRKMLRREIVYAVGYVRVSSEEQAGDDRYSLAMQRFEIERYCKARGWKLVAIYEDAGHSAKGSDIGRRPDFKRMLDDILPGPDGQQQVRCDVVVTHSLDRYARNLIVALTTLGELHAAGITYSSVTESDFDYANPDKRLHLQILAMFAEYFSVRLGRHIKKGLDGRAELGLPNGVWPYGYVNPHAGTSLAGGGIRNRWVPEVVAERAAAVRLAFELYGSGVYSYVGVARALNARGYRMVSRFYPEGALFKANTVAEILASRFYVGEVRVGEAWRPGQHEAIVDRELFEVVQAVRARRVSALAGRTSWARHSYPYVAVGLLRCASCGYQLWAHGGRDRMAGYRDRTRARGLECASRRASVREERVVELLGLAVGGLVLADDWRERLAAAALQSPDLAAAERRRAAITGELERIQDLLLRGLVDEPAYLERRRELQAEAEALPRPRTSIDPERVAARVRDLRLVWAEAEAPERREIAAALFEYVVIDLDDPRRLRCRLGDEVRALMAVLPGSVCTSAAVVCTIAGCVPISG